MRGRLASVAVTVVLAACSSSSSKGQDADAGTAPSAVGGLSCGEIVTSVKGKLDEVIAGASKDLHCADDDDCVVVTSRCECSGDCPTSTLMRADQASPVRVAIDDANGACATFNANHCGPLTLPPGCMGKAAACEAGTCVFGVRASWSSFSFLEVTPGTGLTTPPHCSTGEGCSLRTVTPDGTIAVVNPTRTATVSAADFALVDGILRSKSFRDNPSTGCGPTSADPRIGFSVSRFSQGTLGFDANLCADPTSTTDVSKLYAVVQSY